MRFVLFATFSVMLGVALYYAGWRRGLHAHADDVRLVESTPATSAVPQGAPVRKMHRTAESTPRGSTAPARSALGLPLGNLTRDRVQDTFDSARDGGERRHEATDILAPAGTPVLAMTDGTIARLFLSKPGGITVYEFDPEGIYCYYYAHLSGYAPGLTEGMHVKRGQPIGYVGITGNAGNTPHLHLAITRLGPEKHWWQGEPVNPYPILMPLFD